MTRRIKKVAIIGSGIMGSGIACHFANIGVEVLLLDIVPRELNDKEKAKGLTLESKVVRNRLVNDALRTSLKSKPSPIYNQKFASRITTGNIDDDLHLIKDVDWIMEVVVERLDIKKMVFEKIEKHRTAGTLITSNTSGIPIKFMNEGRSEDFQKHFAVTHFFNPPRYLKLFEVVPGPNCDQAVTDFLMMYGDKFLGKTSVLAKDTPAFIGNRIGIFSIMNLFHIVKEMGLTIEEVDKLTGPVIGRPKSATFRTIDVVGLDTLVHTANGVKDNCPEDEMRAQFEIPAFVNQMMENKWLGSKTKQGFYKKSVNADGKKEILSLDLNTLEYRSKKRASFATLELTKTIDNVGDRFKVLVKGKDRAGEFYRKCLSALFAYVQNRVPEISDEIYRIDDGLRAGFGWEHGPFQIWNEIGVAAGVELMKAEGKEPAAWVTEMLEKGETSFYTVKEGATYYYDIPAKAQIKKPGQDSFIILDNIRKSTEVFKNSGVSLQDIGDGILNLEFRSKMNTIGGDVLTGLNRAIDIAEKDFQGLVVGNQAPNFSVGANIGMIF
ncbi:MAG: 3-hydroxyacyl-CoA dehydrogenase, partial [Polaribacter sp.]|nr:3-hydroxyacyl-CoA dehydrogenase [Polaribacter sp.]